MSLQWDKSIEELDYDPLVQNCIEGLRETEHPYIVVSRLAIKELCQAENAKSKLVPILKRLIAPLRLALQTADHQVFQAALDAIEYVDEMGEILHIC